MVMIKQKIVPHLWFDKEAKEAAEFYCSVFSNSRITNITTFHNMPSGDCDVVSFTLSDQAFMAISAGVLCSKTSILRTWVNFEAGGAWMANKRVIPICHSGLSHKNFPQPLASLQAYTLSDSKDFNNLVELLAKAAELKMPKFDPIRLLKSLPKNEI